MNDNLIQSLSAYINALEQRLSALEHCVALLERQLEANSNTDQDVVRLVTQLQERISALVSRPAEKNDAEPEVEVELIIDEDELSDEPVAESGPESEPIVESACAEPIPEPKPVTEQVTEPVVESKPTMESVAEPVQHIKGVPTQTSLFGSAVQDIRQAISLGDRFLFQRELFVGNGELMQKTLDDINALQSMEDATEYINQHFSWDHDTHAAQLFENVLRRRFN